MITVRNWKRFQHFKDRRPPWIKLYRDLLDDPDWHDLDGDDAKSLTMLWLIASENDGQLPDNRKLAFRLRKNETEVEQLLKRINHWLEQDDIKPISDRYQDDAPETETETETETEKRSAPEYAFTGSVIKLTKQHFDSWLAAYSNLDLRAELTARDAWLAGRSDADRTNWFISTSKYLANRNAEARQKSTEFKWRSGIEGVI